MNRRKFLKGLSVGVASLAVVPMSMLVADKGFKVAPRVNNDLTLESLKKAREEINVNDYLTDTDQWYIVEGI